MMKLNITYMNKINLVLFCLEVDKNMDYWFWSDLSRVDLLSQCNMVTKNKLYEDDKG